MIAIIKNIMSKILKSNDQEVELSPSREAMAEFELKYKKIIIGYLKLHNGSWTFDYSSEFKEQSQISPIVDFPDKYKTYQSETLFPFFASRIPSIKRLKIQNMVLDTITNDEALLLKMFGKQSVANPYILINHN